MTKLMRTSIYVQNIACSGCAHTITSTLSTAKNISNLQVDIENGKVSFDYLNDTDVVSVKEKLNDLGYPPIVDNNTLL